MWIRKATCLGCILLLIQTIKARPEPKPIIETIYPENNYDSLSNDSPNNLNFVKLSIEGQSGVIGIEKNSQMNDETSTLKSIILSKGEQKQELHEDRKWTLKDNIPGEPNTDYPIYGDIPKTSFNCNEKHDGYYADIESRCQVFRVCANTDLTGNGFAFLCPNGTLFNQREFICDWYLNVECKDSEKFYYRNEEIHHVLDNFEEMIDAVRKMQQHRNINGANSQSNSLNLHNVNKNREFGVTNEFDKNIDDDLNKYSTESSPTSFNTAYKSQFGNNNQNEKKFKQKVFVSSLGELSTDADSNFDLASATIINAGSDLQDVDQFQGDASFISASERPYTISTDEEIYDKSTRDRSERQLSSTTDERRYLPPTSKFIIQAEALSEEDYRVDHTEGTQTEKNHNIINNRFNTVHINNDANKNNNVNNSNNNNNNSNNNNSNNNNNINEYTKDKNLVNSDSDTKLVVANSGDSLNVEYFPRVANNNFDNNNIVHQQIMTPTITTTSTNGKINLNASTKLEDILNNSEETQQQAYETKLSEKDVKDTTTPYSKNIQIKDAGNKGDTEDDIPTYFQDEISIGVEKQLNFDGPSVQDVNFQVTDCRHDVVKVPFLEAIKPIHSDNLSTKINVDITETAGYDSTTTEDYKESTTDYERIEELSLSNTPKIKEAIVVENLNTEKSIIDEMPIIVTPNATENKSILTVENETQLRSTTLATIPTENSLNDIDLKNVTQSGRLPRENDFETEANESVFSTVVNTAETSTPLFEIIKTTLQHQDDDGFNTRNPLLSSSSEEIKLGPVDYNVRFEAPKENVVFIPPSSELVPPYTDPDYTLIPATYYTDDEGDLGSFSITTEQKVDKKSESINKPLTNNDKIFSITTERFVNRSGFEKSINTEVTSTDSPRETTSNIDFSTTPKAETTIFPSNNAGNSEVFDSDITTTSEITMTETSTPEIIISTERLADETTFYSTLADQNDTSEITESTVTTNDESTAKDITIENSTPQNSNSVTQNDYTLKDEEKTTVDIMTTASENTNLQTSQNDNSKAVNKEIGENRVQKSFGNIEFKTNIPKLSITLDTTLLPPILPVTTPSDELTPPHLLPDYTLVTSTENIMSSVVAKQKVASLITTVAPEIKTTDIPTIATTIKAPVKLPIFKLADASKPLLNSPVQSSTLFRNNLRNTTPVFSSRFSANVQPSVETLKPTTEISPKIMEQKISQDSKNETFKIIVEDTVISTEVIDKESVVSTLKNVEVTSEPIMQPSYDLLPPKLEPNYVIDTEGKLSAGITKAEEIKDSSNIQKLKVNKIVIANKEDPTLGNIGNIVNIKKDENSVDEKLIETTVTPGERLNITEIPSAQLTTSVSTENSETIQQPKQVSIDISIEEPYSSLLPPIQQTTDSIVQISSVAPEVVSEDQKVVTIGLLNKKPLNSVLFSTTTREPIISVEIEAPADTLIPPFSIPDYTIVDNNNNDQNEATTTRAIVPPTSQLPAGVTKRLPPLPPLRIPVLMPRQPKAQNIAQSNIRNQIQEKEVKENTEKTFTDSTLNVRFDNANDEITTVKTPLLPITNFNNNVNRGSSGFDIQPERLGNAPLLLKYKPIKNPFDNFPSNLEIITPSININTEKPRNNQDKSLVSTSVLNAEVETTTFSEKIPIETPAFGLLPPFNLFQKPVEDKTETISTQEPEANKYETTNYFSTNVDTDETAMVDAMLAETSRDASLTTKRHLTDQVTESYLLTTQTYNDDKQTATTLYDEQIQKDEDKKLDMELYKTAMNLLINGNIQGSETNEVTPTRLNEKDKNCAFENTNRVKCDRVGGFFNNIVPKVITPSTMIKAMTEAVSIPPSTTEFIHKTDSAMLFTTNQASTISPILNVNNTENYNEVTNHEITPSTFNKTLKTIRIRKRKVIKRPIDRNVPLPNSMTIVDETHVQGHATVTPILSTQTNNNNKTIIDSQHSASTHNFGQNFVNIRSRGDIGNVKTSPSTTVEPPFQTSPNINFFNPNVQSTRLYPAATPTRFNLQPQPITTGYTSLGTTSVVKLPSTSPSVSIYHSIGREFSTTSSEPTYPRVNTVQTDFSSNNNNNNQIFGIARRGYTGFANTNQQTFYPSGIVTQRTNWPLSRAPTQQPQQTVDNVNYHDRTSVNIVPAYAYYLNDANERKSYFDALARGIFGPNAYQNPSVQSTNTNTRYYQTAPAISFQNHHQGISSRSDVFNQEPSGNIGEIFVGSNGGNNNNNFGEKKSLYDGFSSYHVPLGSIGRLEGDRVDPAVRTDFRHVVTAPRASGRSLHQNTPIRQPNSSSNNWRKKF